MRTPLDIESQTLAAAAGLMTGLSIFGIWLLNPYLALLLAPAAHVWLLGARAAGPVRPATLAAIAAASLLPALIAFITVAQQLDLGAGAPWQFLLLVEDGQVGFLISLLGCGVIGGLISLRRGRRRRQAGGPPLGPTGSIRGAGTHAGPGRARRHPPGQPAAASSGPGPQPRLDVRLDTVLDDWWTLVLRR